MENNFPLTPDPTPSTDALESLVEVAPPPSVGVSTTSPTTESAGPSRQALIIALVAVFFFAAGLLVGGLLLGGGATNPEELAALMHAVVAEEVAKVSGDGAQSVLINNTSDDPSFGSDDAVITIVEFSDFYCAFCGRFATQTLPQLRAAYGDKVRFVYRDMPIIGGQISVDAAVAANCANAQGKFWEFHNLLFANQGATDATARLAFAGELSMDTTSFETCLADPDMINEVRLDLLDGQGLGISGTPAFYVNGRFVSGAQPFETFQLLIDTELAKLDLE